MTSESIDKAIEAEARSEETRSFIRQVKRITRRQFTAEEKIRIVLEGIGHEVPVGELCRREGIQPNVYYSWLKQFMEAGRERLTHDTARDATRAEVDDLKRENLRLIHFQAALLAFAAGFTVCLLLKAIRSYQKLGTMKPEPTESRG